MITFYHKYYGSDEIDVLLQSLLVSFIIIIGISAILCVIIMNDILVWQLLGVSGILAAIWGLIFLGVERT